MTDKESGKDGSAVEKPVGNDSKFGLGSKG